MKYRRLGGTGPKISELSLGTWMTVGQALDLDASRSLVRGAFKSGINFFDTAQSYPGAEECLGSILQAYPRNEYVVASKCFFPRLENEHIPNARGLSRKNILQSVDDSLRKLRVEYIDIYYCHRFDPDVPLEETVAVLDDLIDAGKILYWGSSQWTSEQIAAANRVARHKMTVSQSYYNLFNRSLERQFFPPAKNEDFGIVAYSPLARGVLTNKYYAGIPANSRAADADGQATLYDLRQHKLEKTNALVPLAKKYGVSVGSIVLAFYLTKTEISSLLIGATSASQVAENCSASGVILDWPDVAQIDLAFASYVDGPEA